MDDISQEIKRKLRGFNMGCTTTFQDQLNEMLSKFLTESETKEPPTFPVIYIDEIVGSVTYVYSVSENKYTATIKITDEKITEDIKNSKKWIDMSFLDLPRIRDFQEEKTE